MIRAASFSQKHEGTTFTVPNYLDQHGLFNNLTKQFTTMTQLCYDMNLVLVFVDIMQWYNVGMIYLRRQPCDVSDLSVECDVWWWSWRRTVTTWDGGCNGRLGRRCRGRWFGVGFGRFGWLRVCHVCTKIFGTGAMMVMARIRCDEAVVVWQWQPSSFDHHCNSSMRIGSCQCCWTRNLPRTLPVAVYE